MPVRNENQQSNFPNDIPSYFEFSTGFNHIPAVYSQNQSSSFQAEARALDDMPTQKVKVGDITIAYKQLGEGSAKPIVLITGLGATMDMWNPLLLEQLSSSNYSVTIFDNRGAGESTAGTKEFRSVNLQMIQQVCLTP